MSSLLLLLLLQDAVPPERERPVLPAARHATLKLDNVPFPDALRRLEEAYGVRIVWEPSWRGIADPPEGGVSLECKDTPLAQALAGIKRPFYVEMGMVIFHGHESETLAASSFHGHFGLGAMKVVEFLGTDFVSDTRSCDLEVAMWWPPDLEHVHLRSATVTRAVDDRGAELAPIPSRFRSWKHTHERFVLAVALPERPAKSIGKLTGQVTLDVPGSTLKRTVPWPREPSMEVLLPEGFRVKLMDDETHGWSAAVLPTRASRAVHASITVVTESGSDGGSGPSYPQRVGLVLRLGRLTAPLRLEIEVVRAAEIQVPFEFREVRLPR